LYVIFNPDGIAHVDRFSTGSVAAGAQVYAAAASAQLRLRRLLAGLDELLERTGWLRLVMGACSALPASTASWCLGQRVPYALIHDGLLMPLFGCLILGLAGINPLSKALRLPGLCFCGRVELLPLPDALQSLESAASERSSAGAGPDRFDPWISYAILVGLGLLALHLVEKPAQKVCGNGWGRRIAPLRYL
jgi:hypothetical protein